MAVPRSFLGLAVLFAPLCLCAQSQQDLAKILERLDRLEQENRELSQQVRDLRAQLGTTAAATPTVEEKLEIQDQRIAEQAQTIAALSAKLKEAKARSEHRQRSISLPQRKRRSSRLAKVESPCSAIFMEWGV